MLPKHTNNTRISEPDISPQRSSKQQVYPKSLIQDLSLSFPYGVRSACPPETDMSFSATFKRFFTPQEANGLLPEVRRLVSRMRILVQEVQRADLILEIAESDELRSDAYSQLEEHRYRINRIRADLRRQGIGSQRMLTPYVSHSSSSKWTGSGSVLA